jgi:threonine dehydratase
MHKTPLEYIPELKIYLKREDLQISGSYKWRLVEYLVKNNSFRNYNELVISSTGNFANAFLTYKLNFPEELTQKITIFISDNLPEIKKNRLVELQKKITQGKIEIKNVKNRTKSSALRYAKENIKRFYVRASTSPGWERAYYSLAEEIESQLSENNINSNTIFVCSSSGTAASGILDKISFNTIIVQTSKVHPFAKEFDNNYITEEVSLANAISDRVGTRKQEILLKLEKNGGSGVIVNNQELAESLEILQKHDPHSKFSANAAISLAGFRKLSLLTDSSYNLKNSIILISGN